MMKIYKTKTVTRSLFEGVEDPMINALIYYTEYPNEL